MKTFIIGLLFLASLPAFSDGIHQSERLGYGYLEPTDFESKIEWSLRDDHMSLAKRVTNYYFNFYTVQEMPKSPDVLYWAVSSGDIRLIQKLLDAGWDVNATDTQLGRTPLQGSRVRGNRGVCNPVVLKTLIDNGADVNAITSEGTIVDSNYRRCRSFASIKLLVENKSLNLNTFSIYGSSFIENIAMDIAPDDPTQRFTNYNNTLALRILELIMKSEHHIEKEILERSLERVIKIGNSKAINLISERLKL